MAPRTKRTNNDALLEDFNRPYITRYQKRLRTLTFPFLKLPGELRNNVYEFCIELGGVEKYFDKYYALLKDCKDVHKVRPPTRFMKTPTVFLINRQIFEEAIGFLQTKSISFTHGLLDIKGIDELVREPVLRNIQSITVSTAGHPMLKHNLLRDSWCGYMDMFAQLSTILSSGHKLKNLTINLDDKDIITHTTLCWNSRIGCDFRDHLKEACEQLRAIRGVECVTITGIPSALALELKKHMESKPVTLLDMPQKIRDRIWGYCADYSDISVQLARTMKGWTNKSLPIAYPKRTTPTVLLLNRKIYSEASAVIYGKPLHLICPANYNIQKQCEVPDMLRFIGYGLLQKIEHLQITAEWEWIYSLDRFLPVLAAAHNLKTFHFVFKDNLKPTFLKHGGVYPDSTLHMSLSGLANVRGIDKVTFSGDLPDFYTMPLVQIMQSAPNTTMLPILKAIRNDGAVFDAE